MVVIQIESRTENETLALGSALGRLLVPGDVVVLQGNLGAGKTVFARGVASGLGCDPTEVQSPTFTIVREYSGGRCPLFHLDIYRLERPAVQLEEIGYEAYFDPKEGVSLIEWGDRAAELLPPKRLDVTIEASESVRTIAIVARGFSDERAAQFKAGLARSGAEYNAGDQDEMERSREL